jgi:hypothetical protein
MGLYRTLLLLILGALPLLWACSYQDPELDRELAKYRGGGIQRDGDRMPRRTPEDEAN